MVCDGVHGNGEGQQVAGHDEDKEDDLCSTEEFSSPFSSDHFTGICHRGDVWISPFHLSDHVAGVCGQ